MSELSNRPDTAPEDQDFLVLTYRLLQWERKAWRITGIIYLISGIFFLIGGALILPAVGENIDLITNALTALIYGIAYLPMGIIGLIAAGKIPAAVETIYFDARPALTRCSSVGRIVFSAIFSGVALIFYLINFIRIKTDRTTVEHILARQSETL